MAERRVTKEELLKVATFLEKARVVPGKYFSHRLKETNALTYPAKSNYRGDVASEYDKKRKKRKKWKLEMNAVKTIADEFDIKTSILDLPLGTGRFLQFYTKGNHKVIGIDISRDMILQAQKRCTNLDMKSDMILGEAERIPIKDNSIDYVICIRLLNWVTLPAARQILKEFQRVTRKGIVLGFRTGEPMSFWNFIRFGIADIIPTPRHLLRWMKLLTQFAGKVKGKLKKTVKDIKSTETVDQVKREIHIRTYYNREEMFRLFFEMKMKACRKFPIDTLASYSKRMIRPYCIYFFKFVDVDKK